MSAYFNENDPFAAQWLRNLIAAGHIAAGDVDERSIVDVRADDLRGYTQCHFFAGIGGWSYALRLAGWDDDRECWSGSCPCQPFSAAGRGKAADDERHLWPAWASLIAECRPPVVLGEQVEAAIGWGWLDVVFADLEAEGYACAASVLPACGVRAPHIRNRVWWVADADSRGQRECHEQRSDTIQPGQPTPFGNDAGGCGDTVGWLADASGERRQQIGRGASRDESEDGRARWHGSQSDGNHLATGDGSASTLEHAAREQVGLSRRARLAGSAAGGMADAGRGFWDDLVWLPCRDGKARPTQPGLQPLAHGVPGRVGRLRAYGNAIVPQVAAEFVAAFMET